MQRGRRIWRMGNSGHKRSTAGAQAPLQRVSGFHDRAGRIFHGGLLGVQVVREGNYRKEQNQCDSQADKTVAATSHPAPGNALHLKLPEEESGNGHQQPGCVQQNFHGSIKLSVLRGTGVGALTLTDHPPLS